MVELLLGGIADLCTEIVVDERCFGGKRLVRGAGA
jgi:hypothetical protein